MKRESGACCDLSLNNNLLNLIWQALLHQHRKISKSLFFFFFFWTLIPVLDLVSLHCPWKKCFNFHSKTHQANLLPTSQLGESTFGSLAKTVSSRCLTRSCSCPALKHSKGKKKSEIFFWRKFAFRESVSGINQREAQKQANCGTF